jgi:hypothetical protein
MCQSTAISESQCWHFFNGFFYLNNLQDDANCVDAKLSNLIALSQLGTEVDPQLISSVAKYETPWNDNVHHFSASSSIVFQFLMSFSEVARWEMPWREKLFPSRSGIEHMEILKSF